VRLALEAMATRFELLIAEEGDPHRLRAIGQEALAEIERAEELWSRFRPTSEIAWVNAGAGGRPVRVGPETLRLLLDCARFAELTDGAFDPTVGPLLRLWGVGRADPPDRPDAAGIARARELVGMQRVEIDPGARTVRLPRKGMELDLGSIGKGAAIDRATEALQAQGIGSALLQGGTSSVRVIGAAPGGQPWCVGWRVPGTEAPVPVTLQGSLSSLAVSAPHGRQVESGGEAWGHVVDPRAGRPTAAGSALVCGQSAAACDALSTAVLVLGEAGPRLVGERFPGWRAERRLGAALGAASGR